jgi:hypothetical protein
VHAGAPSTRFTTTSVDDLLHVAVTDQRMLSTRQVGVVELTVAEFISVTEAGARWFPLASADGGGASGGELKLSVRVEGHYRINEYLRLVEADSENGTDGSAPVLFRAAVQGRPRFPDVRPRATFQVRVIRARNLLAADSTGRSDPFAVVRLNNVSFRTPTEKQTLFPQWNVSYEFGDGLDVLSDSDVLKVDVYDWDRFKRPDFLGSVRIPLWTTIGLHGQDLWLSLKSRDATEARANAHVTLPSKGLGDIQLGVSYFDAPPAAPAASVVAGVPMSAPHPAAALRAPKLAPTVRRADFELNKGKVWKCMCVVVHLAGRQAG